LTAGPSRADFGRCPPLSSVTPIASSECCPATTAQPACWKDDATAQAISDSLSTSCSAHHTSLAPTALRWPVDRRWEPGAGNLHAGLCPGGGSKGLSLPEHNRPTWLSPSVPVPEEPAARAVDAPRARLESSRVRVTGRTISRRTDCRTLACSPAINRPCSRACVDPGSCSLATV
jgi:hypothetical protein